MVAAMWAARPFAGAGLATLTSHTSVSSTVSTGNALLARRLRIALIVGDGSASHWKREDA